MTNTSGEDLSRVQLVLLAFSSTGQAQPVQFVEIDPSDLPIHPNKRTTLTLPASLSLDAEILRLGVGAATPGGEACSEESTLRLAEAEFEPPTVILFNPADAPIHLSDAQLIDGPNPQIAFVASNGGSEPISGVQIEVFVFRYTVAGGGVLRVRSGDLNHGPIAPNTAQPHTVSTHLPPTDADTAKWKFVVVPTSCNVAGHEWRLPDPSRSAKAALTANR